MSCTSPVSALDKTTIHLMEEGGFIHARVCAVGFGDLDENFAVFGSKRSDRLLDERLQRPGARLFAAVQKICLDPRRHDLLNLNCGSIEHVTEAHRVRVNASFRGAVESSKRHWRETKYRRHVQDGRRFLSFEM